MMFISRRTLFRIFAWIAFFALPLFFFYKMETTPNGATVGAEATKFVNELRAVGFAVLMVASNDKTLPSLGIYENEEFNRKYGRYLDRPLSKERRSSPFVIISADFETGSVYSGFVSFDLEDPGAVWRDAVRKSLGRIAGRLAQNKDRGLYKNARSEQYNGGNIIMMKVMEHPNIRKPASEDQAATLPGVSGDGRASP
jgi:hypothetical protein